MYSHIFYARQLRASSTDAERRLWRSLRGRQVCGARFRRQVPLGEYIVDFASFDRRLVIEIDGGQHAERSHAQRDTDRDRWLRLQDFTVLRFWSNDVLSNTAGVLSVIDAAVSGDRPS